MFLHGRPWRRRFGRKSQVEMQCCPQPAAKRAAGLPPMARTRHTISGQRGEGRKAAALSPGLRLLPPGLKGKPKWPFNGNGPYLIFPEADVALVPAQVADGRVLLTLNGSNRNITADCSDSTCYRYGQPDAYGRLHIVLVGGMPAAPGYAESIPGKGSGQPQGDLHDGRNGARGRWRPAGLLPRKVSRARNRV